MHGKVLEDFFHGDQATVTPQSFGAAGSSLSNCLISTCDDGIKVYNDITIDTVTIVHHRNGAPLQFGWSQDSRDVTAVVRNLTIRGADPEKRYNMAPLTWEHGRDGSRQVAIDGLEVITSGEVYDEEKKAWKPIGLLEVKPRECTFNLDVTRARLHGLPLGSSNAKGKVTIEDVAAPAKPSLLLSPFRVSRSEQEST